MIRDIKTGDDALRCIGRIEQAIIESLHKKKAQDKKPEVNPDCPIHGEARK